jgi:predicted solute-binding protein
MASRVENTFEESLELSERRKPKSTSIIEEFEQEKNETRVKSFILQG